MQPHPGATCRFYLTGRTLLGPGSSADSFCVLHNYLCCLLSLRQVPGWLPPPLTRCDWHLRKGWGEPPLSSTLFSVTCHLLSVFPCTDGSGPLVFVGMRFPCIICISFLSAPRQWSESISPDLSYQRLVSGFPPCLHYPPPTAPTLLPWGEASSPTTMQPILVTEEAPITSTPSRVALLSVYFRWKWRYFASSTPEELWHEGVPITQRKPPLFVFLLQERGWLPALSTWKISFCLLQRVRGPQELPLSLVSPQEGLNNPEEGGHRYSLMHTSAAHFVWSLGCQDYPELTGTRVTYMWLVSLSQPQAGAAGSRQDLWPTIHFDCLMKTKFYK